MSTTYSITLASFWKNQKTYSQTLDNLSNCGLSNLEMFGEPQQIDIPYHSELIKSYSFKVTGITGMWGKISSDGWKRRLLSEDLSIKKASEKYVIDCVDLCKNFGGKTLNICLFADPINSFDTTHKNPISDSKIKLLRKNFELINRITKIAVDNGVELVLEPLNRYSTPYCCNIADANIVLESCTDLKLMLDTFHMNIEEDSFRETILKSRSYLKHLHFADNNRRMPGFGHIDFVAIMKTLKDISYANVICFEPTISTPKYIDEVKKGIAYIKEIEDNNHKI